MIHAIDSWVEEFFLFFNLRESSTSELTRSKLKYFIFYIKYYVIFSLSPSLCLSPSLSLTLSVCLSLHAGSNLSFRHQTTIDRVPLPSPPVPRPHKTLIARKLLWTQIDLEL